MTSNTKQIESSSKNANKLQTRRVCQIHSGTSCEVYLIVLSDKMILHLFKFTILCKENCLNIKVFVLLSIAANDTGPESKWTISGLKQGDQD